MRLALTHDVCICIHVGVHVLTDARDTRLPALGSEAVGQRAPKHLACCERLRLAPTLALFRRQEGFVRFVGFCNMRYSVLAMIAIVLGGTLKERRS